MNWRIWTGFLVQRGRRHCGICCRGHPLQEGDTLWGSGAQDCAGKEEGTHVYSQEGQCALSGQRAGGYEDEPGLYCQLRVHGGWNAPYQTGRIHQPETAAHDYAVLRQLPQACVFGI